MRVWMLVIMFLRSYRHVGSVSVEGSARAKLDEVVERGAISLDRMVRAVEKVRERLLRMARALDAAAVPYAVAGGNAVAAWVSTVDEAAVRNTRDVDVLVRRADLPKIVEALETEGFSYRHVAGMDVFLDAPDGSVRDAVHLVFADEMVPQNEPVPNPAVSDSEQADQFRV